MRNNYIFPVILITSLFFLWGFAHNLNPILIPHLKKACQLSDFQSAFIDSAFFIGYFVMALPAGWVMKKYGYKFGIVVGLGLFAFGAFLFYPAADSRAFIFFLAALFIIASGLTFLETAANPYMTILGEKETATQRLNFAQSFNGLAASLALWLGGKFILSGINLTKSESQAMSADQLNQYLNHEASSVKIPYLIIGLVVLTVALLIWRTPLPEIEEEKTETPTNTTSQSTILRHKNLVFGVIAQFFYVGGQVCISSFFIRFADKVAGFGEKTASDLLAGALLGFMIGRFAGTFLMQYIKPQRLLLIYSFANLVLLAFAVFLKGQPAVFALIGVEFFMSIMFPTIFSLGIQGLGSETKIGSSLLIMSIVGGAILPLAMGKISDLTDIQTAYIVPAACFLVVLLFAWNVKSGTEKVISHH